MIWRQDYAGALPIRMLCHVCELGYRPQSIGTAARFLRQHRHCGVNGYEKIAYIGDV